MGANPLRFDVTDPFASAAALERDAFFHRDTPEHPAPPPAPSPSHHETHWRADIPSAVLEAGPVVAYNTAHGEAEPGLRIAILAPNLFSRGAGMGISGQMTGRDHDSGPGFSTLTGVASVFATYAWASELSHNLTLRIRGSAGPAILSTSVGDTSRISAGLQVSGDATLQLSRLEVGVGADALASDVLNFGAHLSAGLSF